MMVKAFYRVFFLYNYFNYKGGNTRFTSENGQYRLPVFTVNAAFLQQIYCNIRGGIKHLMQVLCVLYSLIALPMTAYSQGDFSSLSFIQESIAEQITETYLDQQQLPYLSHFDYRFSSYSLKKIPPSIPPMIDIELLDYSINSGYAQIQLTYHDQQEVVKKKLSGRIKPMVTIPTLSRAHKKETVIDRSAIEQTTIALSRLPDNVILDEEQLHNQQAVRYIRANQPIKSSMISAPYMVQKNQPVTLVYHTDFMHLETTGIAMDSGAKDNVITVRNHQSGKIVNGRITDHATVAVMQ